VSELLVDDPQGQDTLADVGSGAGLPGLVLALVRPQLKVTLIEPLARRAAFLTEAVETLALDDRVEVLRSRAEDVRGRTFRYVTARAVAPLDRLCGWSLPLVAPGGQFLAMKGLQAEHEVEAIRSTRISMPPTRIVQCGQGLVSPLTTVVVVDVTGSVMASPVARTGNRTNRSSRRTKP